eukprot:2957323-Pyramimonas_sp.AAC.1
MYRPGCSPEVPSSGPAVFTLTPCRVPQHTHGVPQRTPSRTSQYARTTQAPLTVGIHTSRGNARPCYPHTPCRRFAILCGIPTGTEIRVRGCEIRVRGCEIRVRGCEISVRGCKIRACGYGGDTHPDDGEHFVPVPLRAGQLLGGEGEDPLRPGVSIRARVEALAQPVCRCKQKTQNTLQVMGKSSNHSILHNVVSTVIV